MELKRQVIAVLVKANRRDLARVIAQEPWGPDSPAANPLELTAERMKAAKKLVPKLEKIAKETIRLRSTAGDLHFNDAFILNKLTEAAERAARKIRMTSQGRLSNLNVF